MLAILQRHVQGSDLYNKVNSCKMACSVDGRFASCPSQAGRSRWDWPTELLSKGMLNGTGACVAELLPQTASALSIAMATSRRSHCLDKRRVLHGSAACFPAEMGAQTEQPGGKILFMLTKRPFQLLFIQVSRHCDISLIIQLNQQSSKMS